MRIIAPCVTKSATRLIALIAPILLIGITHPVQADMSSAPAIPNQPPLKTDEIIKLLDGKSYTFTDFDQPVTGTTTWNYKEHTVSGNYVYAGIKKGDYTAQWTVTGDKSCTTDKFQGTLCQTVYAYENGYMEVNSKGKVHAISVPK